MLTSKYGIQSKQDLIFLLQSIASDLETTANEALEQSPGEKSIELQANDFQWLAYLITNFVQQELS